MSTHNICFHGEIRNKRSITVLALREVWESETPKNCPGISKNQYQEVWDSQVLNIFSHLKILNEFVLFSLRMAILLHK